MVSDAIIVLGGGRTNQGNLTELSIQRLDKGYELYRAGVAPKIFVLGGHFSTYSPNAINFRNTGAEIRRDYLCSLGVSREDVVMVPDGRDTILEAFACRKVMGELGIKKVALVTSDKHMERALFIFKRILGNETEVESYPVPCGDLLNEAEEREYLDLVKTTLDTLPREIPDSTDDKPWFGEFRDFYRAHTLIHNKYHPAGKESQAYLGVERI